MSTFQEAVLKGDLSSVKRLLDGEDETLELSHGSYVCLAVREKHMDIVELLLQRGFDVNLEDTRGNRPIDYSAGQNDVLTTELLLQSGAELNNKCALLFSAARKGFEKIVEVLVDFGADVNAKDDCGQTALHHAILKDSAVFTFLDTAIKDTCTMEDVVKVLLVKGSDVNAKTVNGFTALHFAIKLKFSSIVSILLEHGADFHSLVDCNIKSPKLYQFRQKTARSVTLGRLSIKPCLTTVLHIAAESNDVASLTMLLNAGAVADSVQYDGTTPLIVAMKRQHDTIARKLLDFGADVEQRTKYGMTPLHVACGKGLVNVLNSLLDAGANVNATCNNGKVPYEYLLQLEVERADEYCSKDLFEISHHYYTQIYKNSIAMKAILQKHLIIMYINGFYLQDYNKQVAINNTKYFHTVSKKELKEFSKNVIICNKVTLYHVLYNMRNPSYIRNPNVLKGLKQALVATDEKYSGLGNVVKFLVRKARARMNLMDKGIERFMDLNRKYNQLPTLPFDTLEVVFSFLIDEEIQSFINCDI